MRAALVLAVGAVWACSASPQPVVSNKPKIVPASGPTPAERARKIFDAQRAAPTSGDEGALKATFTDDAIIFAEREHRLRGLDTAAWFQIGSSAQIDSWGEVRIEAGGDDTVIWFAAEADVKGMAANEVAGEAPFHKHLRYSEVATAASGWKVVAASVASVESYFARSKGDAMPDATPAGPVAQLLAVPSPLADRLDAGAIYAGATQDDPVLIRDARDRVRAWAAQQLVPAGVREVHVGPVAFVQAIMSDGSRIFVVTRDAKVVLVHVLPV